MLKFRLPPSVDEIVMMPHVDQQHSNDAESCVEEAVIDDKAKLVPISRGASLTGSKNAGHGGSIHRPSIIQKVKRQFSR